MSSNNSFENELRTALREIALGGLRFFDSIGSTNDQALAWAASRARDFSLVVADEQTAGRGRMGRAWFTPPGSALAFSLILRLTRAEREMIGRFSGLAALALVQVLAQHGVQAQIKWPNDVLIERKKTAGILVETVWLGDEVDSLVLGMGVNVGPGSVPPADAPGAGDVPAFPATCLQSEGLTGLARFVLLKELLERLRSLRAGLAADAFLESWEAALAFRGEQVHIWQGSAPSFGARLIGLEADGSLRLELESGELRVVNFGEVHLRPAA